MNKEVDILLVEDDPHDVELTLHAFSEHKLTNAIHVVRDGAEALDYLLGPDARTGSATPKCVLLDLKLPKIDGLEVPPCLADPCRALSDSLSALVGLLQSLQAHAVVQRIEFERLQQRWVDGADHRGTMELYHELFSFVDGAISLVTDLLDALTPDL